MNANGGAPRVAVNMGGRRRRFRGIWAVAVRRTRVHHLRGSDADQRCSSATPAGSRRQRSRWPSSRRPASTWCGSPRPTASTRRASWATSPPTPRRVQIAAGILPIYTRTPTLIAMTAAGLDALSDGRCHPRPRRVRPAGHRGLARRALRHAARPHPRDHRDLPQGLGAARQARARRAATTPARSPRDRAPGSASRSRSSPTPCATASRSGSRRSAPRTWR